MFSSCVFFRVSFLLSVRSLMSDVCCCRSGRDIGSMWCWWRRSRPGRKLRCVIQLLLSFHHSLFLLFSVSSSLSIHPFGHNTRVVISSLMFPQEKERLKQEKRDEKRLNKQRRLELRRLELEMVKELNKPTEDMCLSDHKVNYTESF